MYYVMLVTSCQWTAVSGPHLVCSPHFIPILLCLVRILYLSPCLIPSPQCVFHTACVNRHQSCLFHYYSRQHAFISTTRTINLFTNMTLNRLGFSVPRLWDRKNSSCKITSNTKTGWSYRCALQMKLKVFSIPEVCAYPCRAD